MERWFWLIPVACGVASVIFAITGLPAVVRSRRVAQEHAQRLQAAPVAIFDATRLETAVGRINQDVNGLLPLLERASAAMREIRDGLEELRLREAMVALRLAGIAIRALAKLR